jgi:hypothetical protein
MNTNKYSDNGKGWRRGKGRKTLRGAVMVIDDEKVTAIPSMIMETYEHQTHEHW